MRSPLTIVQPEPENVGASAGNTTPLHTTIYTSTYVCYQAIFIVYLFLLYTLHLEMAHIPSKE